MLTLCFGPRDLRKAERLVAEVGLDAFEGVVVHNPFLIACSSLPKRSGELDLLVKQESLNIMIVPRLDRRGRRRERIRYIGAHELEPANRCVGLFCGADADAGGAVGAELSFGGSTAWTTLGAAVVHHRGQVWPAFCGWISVARRQEF